VVGLLAVPLIALAAVAAPPDPLGCDAPLFDPDGTLDPAQVDPAIDRVASRLGAEVRVRVERTLDAGLDARMAQLEAQCPDWTVAGERDPDLVVVMYSAQEREAAVYYGADQSLVLDARWEPAVDAMIAEFRDGRFTEGVVDGLTALTTPALAMPIDSVEPLQPSELPAVGGTGGGTGFPTGFILVFVLVLAVVAALNVARYLKTGEWGDASASGHRHRSFGSFGGSRSFGSFGGSRSSSSRGSGSSGRAGGGSKRW
jgi:uncharacterized membrane protein YgcG